MMQKQIEALRDAIDQTATDYVKHRSDVSDKLTEKDAETFGFIISAKKNLSWALDIIEEQNAQTD